MLTLLPYSASKKSSRNLNFGCRVGQWLSHYHKRRLKKWLGVSKLYNGKENQGNLISLILWAPANGTIHSSLLAFFSVECGQENSALGDVGGDKRWADSDWVSVSVALVTCVPLGLDSN